MRAFTISERQCAVIDPIAGTSLVWGSAWCGGWSSPHSIKRRGGAAGAITSMALLSISLAGCDPCVGTLSCTSPAIRYEGQVVSTFRGDPLRDIPVAFVRQGGARLSQDTVRAVSDSTGRFLLEMSTLEEGEVRGSLLFDPPAPLEQVVIEDEVLFTTRTSGDLRFLGIWEIPYPHLRYVGELYYRKSGLPAEGLLVEFRRTGGVKTASNTMRWTTDANGRFLIDTEVFGSGQLQGELTVTPLPPFKPFTVPNVEFRTLADDSPVSLAGRWGVGPHLPYSGLLVWSDLLTPAADVEVEFVRTGGIPVVPERFVTRTNRFGTFALDPVPSLDGVVIGELRVRPPPPYLDFVISNVTLSTVDLDQPSELIGQWQIPRK